MADKHEHDTWTNYREDENGQQYRTCAICGEDEYVGRIDYKQRLAEMTSIKDHAYRERDMVLALVASAIQVLSPHSVWLGRHREDDLEWEDDWRNVVFILLPTGQLSWHIHDSELPWFARLDKGSQEWDGHDVETKYKRLLAFVCDLHGEGGTADA